MLVTTKYAHSRGKSEIIKKTLSFDFFGINMYYYNVFIIYIVKKYNSYFKNEIIYLNE